MSWDPSTQYGGRTGVSPSGLVSPGGDMKATLWMGDLDPWMDDSYIKQLWFSLGETVNVKMIRDKFTGGNAGYCFVEFQSHANAVNQLTQVNGTLIPGTNRVFKLNWASGGGLNDRKDDRAPEYSVFVGDLGPEVNDFMLLATFQNRYLSCRSAKVVTDPTTGMSRGYGFVRFGDESEQQRAMAEMHGQYCGSRPMRLSVATPKNKSGSSMMMPGMGPPTPQMAMAGFYPAMSQMQGGYNQFTDPNNTTVFVGGLSATVHEDELRSYFAPFGEITYVKIPNGKGCGFVQYLHRQSAEMAILQMQNAVIGGTRVRLSWGRSQNDKPVPSPQMQFRTPGPFMQGQMGGGFPGGAYGNMGMIPGPNQQQLMAQGMQMGMNGAGYVEDPLMAVGGSVTKMNDAYIGQKEELLERNGEMDPTGWRQPHVYAQ